MLNSSDTRPVSAERYLKVPSSDDNSIIKKEANENLIRSHDSIGFSCGSGSGDDLSAELYKRAGSAEFIRQKSSAGNKLLLVLLLLMIYSGELISSSPLQGGNSNEFLPSPSSDQDSTVFRLSDPAVVYSLALCLSLILINHFLYFLVFASSKNAEIRIYKCSQALGFESSLRRTRFGKTFSSIIFIKLRVICNSSN